MSSSSTAVTHSAGVAFDSIAERYDEIFTESLIGRAQRDAVWAVLRQTFRAGDRVLELNCGTGEDALFLGAMGVLVYACDASEGMIAVATRRMGNSRGQNVKFEVRPTEQIGSLPGAQRFDGVLSDFAGLNCVADLSAVAGRLKRFISPGGRLVFCVSSRFCLWETLWYLAHGMPARAVRRWKGHAHAKLGDQSLHVFYPTVGDIRRMFGQKFVLRNFRAIGLFVPPSYLEHLARRYPGMLNKLQALDHWISSWPGFRVLGDHILLVLENKG